MVEKLIFKGVDAIKLENDGLKVLILPDIGSKIASIYRKDKDFEVLFQNKEGIYRKPKLGDKFAEFDASGFDDAFPTIDRCIVKYEGREIEYPDHGEVWSATFNYEIINDKIKLWFESAILPCRYEKNIWLEGEKLKLHYKIKNNGKTEFPCMWIMHCLARCEEDMILKFPPGTKEVVNVQKSSKLGEVDSIHPFPVTTSLDGNIYRLDRVLPRNSGHTEKYYVNGMVKEGVCSIYYPSQNVTFEIKFDKNKLPYLGFWVTEGGFRGDYNCAFEPTNGFYDSIDIAKKKNKLFYLKSKEEFEFDIEISLK
ncbi:MAG TPA: DUF5107 domain-containing protein [Thermoanaerobacter sp.]|nr:DUF5107 domain-containing protein [Thermoanaerobacter sp.]